MQQQLGDSLGKGAFGQVYRTCCPALVSSGFPDFRACGAGALNWATGETVAIKEIQLSNIPKSEIGQIMVRRLPEHALHWQSGLDASRSPRSIC